MFAYTIVSASLLGLMLLFFLYQGFTESPFALLFALPMLVAGTYVGLTFIDKAPLALGIVALILMSVEALAWLIMIVAGALHDEGEMGWIGTLLLLPTVNTIVYLGCAF